MSRALPISSRLAVLLLLAACQRGALPDPAQLISAQVDTTQLRRDITWLASDARGGRGTGTSGFDSAAAFVVRRHQALGIGPAPSLPDYRQPFTARPLAERGGTAVPLPTQNVVAMIPGTDPVLKDQYLILGAHLDHLGRTTRGALDPEAGDAIRNGADDNASGSVAILELARRFKQAPTKRSILIVHFSGEELGLLGSEWFATHSPVPLPRVQAMLNFDMVGRLNGDRLIVYGVSTAAPLSDVLTAASAGSGLVVRKVPDGVGPSDHASFFTKDVPVLHFFTDIHDDYHRASDDATRINVEGMWRVIEMAERTARDLGDRSDKLAVVRAPVTAAAAPGGSRQSSGVYFGSVPDMAAGDVVGMPLSGVRPGSPADKGGLKTGDIIVEFGGKPITDIYTYTDALNSFKPDDVVTVVVMRGTERLSMKVTLTRRGS